jgi:hypothetical protein
LLNGRWGRWDILPDRRQEFFHSERGRRRVSLLDGRGRRREFLLNGRGERLEFLLDGRESQREFLIDGRGRRPDILGNRQLKFLIDRWGCFMDGEFLALTGWGFITDGGFLALVQWGFRRWGQNNIVDGKHVRIAKKRLLVMVCM